MPVDHTQSYPTGRLIALAWGIDQMLHDGGAPVRQQEEQIAAILQDVAGQVDGVSPSAAGDLRRMAGGLEGRVRRGDWQRLTPSGVSFLAQVIWGAAADLALKGLPGRPAEDGTGELIVIDFPGRSAVIHYPTWPMATDGGDAA
ncbi:hypothetical protein [Oceanibaculum indicum]|uniref:Uncharacterized protein n=1 Tax=Oceanibaculum indicum P24 TaxID=1207063 RepID=K2JSK2_9PROT|nr:hypothetical protein [Oceanibaculum indicum]EKE78463.1 hypothetical protein P24_02846 [Oceanibaculum indicum P24]